MDMSGWWFNFFSDCIDKQMIRYIYVNHTGEQWRAQTFWGAGAQGGREGHFLAHAEHLIIKKLHAHVEWNFTFICIILYTWVSYRKKSHHQQIKSTSYINYIQSLLSPKMNSRHLGEVDKLHFALHCLLFTLHFLLRTALKQHPSNCKLYRNDL